MARLSTIVRFAAGLAVGGLTIQAACANPVSGNCSPTKVKFIASDSFAPTTSLTFMNLTESVVNFTQGGTSPSCVIVSVSADPISAPQVPGNPAPLTVRAVIDRVLVALPNEVDFSDGGDSGNQVRSFDFIFPEIAPGAHSVRIQFKTVSAGLPGTTMNRHNVIVNFAP